MSTRATIPASTEVTLSDGRRLIVVAGDFPAVASEVFAFAEQLRADMAGKLAEFLDERESAAPASVGSVRLLDCVLDFEFQRWLRNYVK